MPIGIWHSLQLKRAIAVPYDSAAAGNAGIDSGVVKPFTQLMAHIAFLAERKREMLDVCIESSREQTMTADDLFPGFVCINL
jgi:hypothetical protein